MKDEDLTRESEYSLGFTVSLQMNSEHFTYKSMIKTMVPFNFTLHKRVWIIH